MTKPSKPQKPSSEIQTKPIVSQSSSSQETNTQPDQNFVVQPEHTSLIAHQHIQSYMTSKKLVNFGEDDLTAVLRLSSHLRIFGLLSAIGYINQSNAQAGKVREKTVPVWSSLLGQLINDQESSDPVKLMQQVLEMAKKQPHEYMFQWQRALLMSNHWNFWARAYKGQKK